MGKHDDLFAAVQKALHALFADQSVPRSVTRASFAALRDEIKTDIEALDDDERAEDADD